MARAEPIRVYLLDDVPAMRLVLRTVLELDGIEVVGEAGDGREGVDEIAELRPDVAVLDLSMPGLDGLEAIPLIHERSPGTAIVVFSGFARSQMGEQALGRKAARYVEKGEPLELVRDAVVELAA
jgi:DNA-binding NarL/FixJ family response regulator